MAPTPESPGLVIVHPPVPRQQTCSHEQGRIDAERRLRDLRHEVSEVALVLDELGNGAGGDPIVRQCRDRLRKAMA